MGVAVVATPTTKGQVKMATQGRALQFNHSLREWGNVFMLTVWLQSIMTSAIAMKDVESTRVGTIVTPDPEYFRTRNRLMKEEMSGIWSKFQCTFSHSVITKDEELTADMIILLRNQLAHCFISSGRGFALFLPKPSSQKLLGKLKEEEWIDRPRDAESDPVMLIIREGDKEWLAKNAAMITGFLENTILRITRAHGIDDATVC